MGRIEFLPERCCACGACAVACMDQNDIDIPGGERPFRRVFRREREGVSEYVSAACRHCGDAPCAAACPTGAMYREDETGLVLCDRARCVGCGKCASACPHDGVSLFRRPGEDRPRAEKCDGCRARVLSGLDPACVRACPFGALVYR